MRKILTIILVCGINWGFAQKAMAWQMLQLTTYQIINEGPNQGLYKPNFPSVLEKYDGEEVMISGYIIPMDIDNNSYALSMSPFSSCFFCGNAGPNTVIELRFKEKQSKFLVDQFLMIKGIFILNENNPNALFFKITGAEIHG